MLHPLVTQLRFARSELQRGLAGLPADDAVRRLQPLNCISWMIGHLADQEQRYWLIGAQNKTLVPDLTALVGFGQPASTPPLAEVWAYWEAITQAADPYLDSLTPEILQTHLVHDGQTHPENIGTMLQRTLYHYWFHLGEAMAVRQMLGHTDLPQFVGALGAKAPYRAEVGE